MKRIFGLLLCFCAVAVAGCNDEKSGGENNWFELPQVGEVTGTTVVVVCPTSFGEGVLASGTPGFTFAPIVGSEIGAYQFAEDVRVDGAVVTCRLTGLNPETFYVGHAFVRLGGQQFESRPLAFQTGASSGGDGDGDGDGGSGNTKYAGWAELPEEQQNSDYHYAYHICPDAYVDKTSQKMRNFAVCYSERLRCPVWIAAPMHDGYLGDAKRRNKYIDDPKISCTQNTEYNHAETNLTRGHMLGSSDRTVTQATNDQVFYKSNIGPQIQSGFNEGGGLWNNCEDKFVDVQWKGKADTTYQVLGCYWENESKKVNGTTVPTHYYKVLLRTKNHVNKWVSSCSREELQCVAVFMPHNSQHKGTVPSQYISKGFVMTVADLEKKTGHTFFGNVPNAPKDTYNRADWDL